MAMFDLAEYHSARLANLVTWIRTLNSEVTYVIVPGKSIKICHVQHKMSSILSHVTILDAL